MDQELRHVETDAAGTDHGHGLAHRRIVAQHIGVDQHLFVINTVNLWHPWADACGQHDFVVPAGQQGLCRGLGAQLHRDARQLQLTLEVAQRMIELLLAGDPLGHVELTADLLGPFDQGDLVTPFGRLD